MKLTCLLLSAALLTGSPLVAGTMSEREDPPPQDPNAAPAEQAEPDQAEPDAEATPPETPEVVPPAPVALGDFAMKLATSMGLPPPATGYTPESAAWVLSLKGIKVRQELASPLTEADAVAALTGLGYKIRTTTPSRVMTADRVDLVLSTFIISGRS